MGVFPLIKITILALCGQENVAGMSDNVSSSSPIYTPTSSDNHSPHDTSFSDTAVDQTLQNMSPSLSLNVSASSSITLFTKPSSTMVNPECSAMFCQNEPGYYVLNTAACSGNSTPQIYLWEETTIDIVTKTTELETDIQCLWKMDLFWADYAILTVDQLATDYREWDGNFTLDFRDDQYEHVFNERMLRKRHATFPLSKPMSGKFENYAPQKKLVMNIHIVPKYGLIQRTLPVVHLSEFVSYVTSPRQKGDDKQLYPNNYDGVFRLNFPGNESALISFTHFSIEKSQSCKYDYVTFKVTKENQAWKKCGEQSIPLMVLHSPMELYFHSDHNGQKSGFKMMFAILPRSKEPQQLSINLLNCSVLHFHMFQPLLNCNLERECQDGEDEQNCDYYSDDCQHGDIDAGTKCYKLFRQENVTWTNADDECSQNGYKLAMLTTMDEFRRFVEIVSKIKNINPVHIGARFVRRLQTFSAAAMDIYRQVWQWVDGRTAFIMNFDGSNYDTTCAIYRTGHDAPLNPTRCHEGRKADFFCEYEKPNMATVDTAISNSTGVHISINSKEQSWNVSMMQCPAGHLTREFLSCDSQELCRTSESITSCQMRDTQIVMFLCQGSQTVLHYSLVCDLVQHCTDGSDENFCDHPPCPSTAFQCLSGQCISKNQFCDLNKNCFDGTDELACLKRKADLFLSDTALPPAILSTDGKGRPIFRSMSDSDNCPNTHFQCPDGYCLPIYLFCNGIPDCPRREDEAECDNYVCPGLYRCQDTKVCLHPDNVCDGVFHCPQYDDEMLCEESCPDECHCQGLAFVCTANFSASSYIELRYLDASGTGMNPGDLIHNLYLIYLQLSKCRIKVLPTLRLPNVIYADLSWNNLESIDIHQFHMLQNLRVLVLSGNPLTLITNSAPRDAKMMKLLKIDISHTGIKVYNGRILAKYRKNKVLNISASKLTTITKEGFHSTLMLETLDVRGSPLQNFPRDLLKHLIFLKVVYADNYILCCKVMLPDGFDPKNCHAEQDLLASCEDLLKSNTYRVSLWVFASLSIMGNLCSFVGRLYLHTYGSGVSSFSVFVTSLSVADFVMGVYLAMIGVADLVFHGEYLWHDVHWKNSIVCSIAGFLSVLSNEVSAFLICLITLDRLLVLRFPFSTVHFNRRSALVACGIIWTIGSVLAIIPLLPMTSFWEFYSQTSICIPLPFMDKETFMGYTYSFTVMIILNFILFVLIAVGQAVIYFSIRSNSMKMTASKDATIARRLTTVAVSDFLCWFPVGLLGLLASTGTVVPGELSVAVVIFVLPLNSALNPFLYTFNVFMEKRLKAQEAAILERLGKPFTPAVHAAYL